MNIQHRNYLRDFLTKQMDGFTGHIEIAGFPFGVVEWGRPDVLVPNGPS